MSESIQQLKSRAVVAASMKQFNEAVNVIVFHSFFSLSCFILFQIYSRVIELSKNTSNAHDTALEFTVRASYHSLAKRFEGNTSLCSLDIVPIFQNHWLIVK